MKVAFRVDSSVEIGAGHLMRCLTLANALREDGVGCDFVCQAHPGHLADNVRGAGHHLHLLPFSPGRDPSLPGGWQRDAEQTKEALGPASCDWLVVDHYALDARWEREMERAPTRLMVIDDLANRPHACDLLLDQGLGRAKSDYEALVPRGAGLLLGVDYALLRPEFQALREYSMQRRESVPLKRILVSLGGFDQNNDTGRVLDALSSSGVHDDICVSVVMGRNAPHLASVRERAGRLPFRCDVRVGVTDMAALMAECELAIGAAGGSVWERSVLGVPSIVLVVAENQRSNAEAIEAARAAIVLPPLGTWTTADFSAALDTLSNAVTRDSYSKSAARLVDGRGTHRVKAAMEAVP